MGRILGPVSEGVQLPQRLRHGREERGLLGGGRRRRSMYLRVRVIISVLILQIRNVHLHLH